MARTREGSTGHFGVDPEDAAGTPRGPSRHGGGTCPRRVPDDAVTLAVVHAFPPSAVGKV